MPEPPAGAAGPPAQSSGLSAGEGRVSESMNGAVPADPAPDEPTPTRRGRPRPLRWLSSRLPEARADRALVVATLTAVLVVGGSTLAIVHSTPNVAKASEDAPTFDPRATPTTTLPPTSTTMAAAAPRTAPIDPPADPHAAVPVV